MFYCTNCQNALNGTPAVCPYCGAALSYEVLPNMQSNMQPLPPRKKRRVWIPILCVVLSLCLVVGLCGICLRIPISRYTNGILFGLHMGAGDLDKLLAGEEDGVSSRQEKKYINYVTDLESETRRGLSEDQNILADECEAVAMMMSEYSTGQITLTEENIQKEFNRAYKAVSGTESFWDKLFAASTLQAYAFDTEAEAKMMGEVLSAQMLHNMSAALMTAGEYDVSLILGSLAALKDPDNASTAVLLANLLRQGGNDKDAEEMLKYALMLEPASEDALVSLGMLYLDMGKYHKARTCFNSAFQVSGGGGPANQGMMLVSFAEGDMGSAYLYMLEGAKEGYTSTITDVYNQFIRLSGSRENYLNFAGPILEQYGFENLMNFKRSRMAFDPTLDTPGQQLTLDRTFELPTTGGEVISTSLIAMEASFEHLGFLLNTLFGDMDLSDLIDESGNLNLGALFNNERLNILLNGQSVDSSALREALGTISSAMGGNEAIDTITGIIDVIDNIAGQKKEEVVVYGGDNFEQEEFWLNILYDYTEYQFYQIQKKYYTDVIDQHMTKTVEDSMDNMLAQMDKMPTDPIGFLVTSLMNMLDNGSFLTTSEYTDAEVQRFSSDFCPVNRYMEEGYKEAVILAEQYWLYSNNILGYIADDAIYNKELIQRNALTATVTTFFPIASSMTNATIGLTANVWGGLTFDMYFNGALFETSLRDHIRPGGAVYPEVPELPITGMGTTGKPDLIIDIPVPEPEDIATTLTDIFDGSEIKPGSQGGSDTETGQDGTGDGQGGTGGATIGSNDEGVLPGYEDQEQEVCIIIDPGFGGMVRLEEEMTMDPALSGDGQEENGGQSGEGTQGMQPVEDPDYDTSIGISLGKFFEAKVNPQTGKTEVGLGWMIGGFKAGYDPVSGDLYLYGRAGLDVDLGVEAGPVEVNAGGVKAGLFMKGTYNLKKKQVVSTDVGAEAGVSLPGYKVDTAVSYDPVLGVKRDTATLILNGEGNTITTESKVGEETP